MLGELDCALEGCSVRLDFDYQKGLNFFSEKYFLKPLKTHKTLDYSIYRVYSDEEDSKLGFSFNPSAWIDTTDLDFSVAENDEIYMIGHPSSALKKYSKGKVTEVSNALFSHTAFSLGGNSGSVIINSKGHLIGIHHSGNSSKDFLTKKGYEVVGYGTKIQAISDDFKSNQTDDSSSLIANVSTFETEDNLAKNSRFLSLEDLSDPQQFVRFYPLFKTADRDFPKVEVELSEAELQELTEKEKQSLQLEEVTQMSVETEPDTEDSEAINVKKVAVRINGAAFLAIAEIELCAEELLKDPYDMNPRTLVRSCINIIQFVSCDDRSGAENSENIYTFCPSGSISDSIAENAKKAHKALHRKNDNPYSFEVALLITKLTAEDDSSETLNNEIRALYEETDSVMSLTDLATYGRLTQSRLSPVAQLDFETYINNYPDYIKSSNDYEAVYNMKIQLIDQSSDASDRSLIEDFLSKGDISISTWLTLESFAYERGFL